jgi:hypothetical protein
MNMKKEKIKQIYSLIFLLGYLSFVGLSTLHHHPVNLNSRQNTEDVSVSKTAEKKISESADDCPVCHLYFSINVCSNINVSTDVFADSLKFFICNESIHFNKLTGNLSLRGPPANNFYLA